MNTTRLRLTENILLEYRSYMHTYIHTYIHTYRHTYIHTYILHTYIHSYTHADRQTDIHTHTHTRTHTDRNIYIHTHMYICIYTHRCRYISLREICVSFFSNSQTVSRLPATSIRPGTLRCWARTTPTYLSQVVSSVRYKEPGCRGSHRGLRVLATRVHESINQQ